MKTSTPIRTLFLAGVLAGAALSAHADAIETLRGFVREVPSGRASFTQTVVSPDGARKKTSSGSFAFQRPNLFRFAYDKPYAQLIVSDGRQVWLHDQDLNQVTVRPFDQALGATPAALLAGTGLERDFTLANAPSRNDGLEWVQATPKAGANAPGSEGTVRQLNVGFKGRELAALEIVDSFGQRSTLRFTGVQQGLALPADTFRFQPPAGADVLKQ